eukprot:COSAG04_NODE_9063_length_902_cov_1.599004_2_plen_22_part_01
MKRNETQFIIALLGPLHGVLVV